MSTLKIISQNMAAGSLYLHHLLANEKPDVLFCQENMLKSVDLLAKVSNFGYKCEANVNILNPLKPGTAVVWRENLPTPQINNLVERHLQSFSLGACTFLNIYAPSGSSKRRDGENLFSLDLFQFLVSSTSLPWLVGDWNCLTEELQTTANFKDKFSKTLKDIKYNDAFSMLHPGVQEFTFHRSGWKVNS